MTDLVARLKSYDPKRQHTMRVFVLGNQRFDAGVWVAVDARTAEVLRSIRQSYYDPFSPVAFDVQVKQEVAADANDGDVVGQELATQTGSPPGASASGKPGRKGRS